MITSNRHNLINLGCGLSFHKNWDNYDLYPADKNVRHIDLLQKLPLDDLSYDCCYCSHVLEHIQRGYAKGFISEAYRILKSGGVFRVVVPDLEAIARLYLEAVNDACSGNEDSIARHQWMTIELLDQLTRSFSGGFMGRLWYSRPLLSRNLIEERLGNEATHWLQKFDQDFLNGAKPIIPEHIYDIKTPTPKEESEFRNKGEIHRWMYDRISLKELLKQAGFRDVKVCNATESMIPNFNSYHLDTDAQGRVRKPDSLFMEGTK